MSMEDQIIKDLAVSQTTSSALALRLKLRTTTVETHLLKMEQAGTVRRKPICDGRLIVWTLSRAQKEEV